MKLADKFNNFDSKKLMAWLAWIFAISTGCLVGVILSYMIFFNGGFSHDQTIWGTFGDYVGGTLGPILSFFSLFALLLTIILQSRQVEISRQELEASRKELELTREELAKTAEAAQAQTQHFQNESRRADLYRIIEKLTTRINKNYNENRLENNYSVHLLMRGSENINENDVLDFTYNRYQHKDSQTFRVVKWLEDDLFRLSEYIQEYENIGDSKSSHPFPAFYKREFSEFIELFHKYNMINSKVFDFYCK